MRGKRSWLRMARAVKMVAAVKEEVVVLANTSRVTTATRMGAAQWRWQGVCGSVCV